MRIAGARAIKIYFLNIQFFEAAAKKHMCFLIVLQTESIKMPRVKCVLNVC